jgi:hypothetical protein
MNSWRSEVPLRKITCLNCGKVVEKYESQASKFCCPACYWDYKGKTLFDKVCPVCKSQFKGRVKQHYCSEICKRKRDHNQERGQYEHICPRCGKTRYRVFPSYAKEIGLCKSCAVRKSRDESPSPKGSESAAWKGGRRLDSMGYVKIHDANHPFADATNYVREHIYVVCQAYGVDYFREQGGTVHHINGDKQDNRLENLYVCTQQQNTHFSKDLLQLAYRLIKAGVIEFENGKYGCPLLGDEAGEDRQTR